MNKLSPEHPFFEFMGNVGDWILLNVLFVLTSLPMVTIGMSLTALYKTALRRTRGESCYVFREYVQACREEWKQGTLLWLGFLFTGGLLLFDLWYAFYFWKGLLVFVGGMAVLWGFLFSYVFALQARFSNTIKNTLKNALYLSFQNLPYTLVMLAFNAIPLLCFALGAYTVILVLPVYCAIGFSLTAKINSIFLTKIFRTLEQGK